MLFHPHRVAQGGVCCSPDNKPARPGLRTSRHSLHIHLNECPQHASCFYARNVLHTDACAAVWTNRRGVGVCAGGGRADVVVLSPEQPSSRRRSSSGGSLVFKFKSGQLTAAGTYTVAAEYTETREHLVRVRALEHRVLGLTHKP